MRYLGTCTRNRFFRVKEVTDKIMINSFLTSGMTDWVFSFKVCIQTFRISLTITKSLYNHWNTSFTHKTLTLSDPVAWGAGVYCTRFKSGTGDFLLSRLRVGGVGGTQPPPPPPEERTPPELERFTITFSPLVGVTASSPSGASLPAPGGVAFTGAGAGALTMTSNGLLDCSALKMNLAQMSFPSQRMKSAASSQPKMNMARVSMVRSEVPSNVQIRSSTDSARSILGSGRHRCWRRPLRLRGRNHTAPRLKPNNQK